MQHQFSSIDLHHAVLPPFDVTDEPSVSAPLTIEFTFQDSVDGLVQRRSGRVESREVPALAGGAVPAEGLAWVRSGAPAEIVEIMPSADLLASVADHYRRDPSAPYPEFHGVM